MMTLQNKGVLHVTDGLHPKRGGLPTAVLNITGLFQFAKIPFTILSIGENPDELPEYVVPFSNVGNSRFAISKEAIEWFRKNHKFFTFIYFHSVWNTTILNLYKIALKDNAVYFISPHGSLDPYDLQKKSLLKKVLGSFIVNKILVNAKYIFCTSQIEKETLYYFGKKTDNCKVLPLPVDYTEGINGNRDAFRKANNIKAKQFVFLFLSRINYKKGLDNFIQVLSELVKAGKIPKADIRLVIAGDDKNPYSDMIRKMITEEKLGDVITFTGLLTGQSKADAYKGADLFVLPSKNENFGLAIVEALQSGTPVLISKNVYIYKELFENRPTAPGWLCDENLSDLETIVLQAFENRDNLEEKMESAREAGRMFTSQCLLKEYKKYFTA